MDTTWLEDFLILAGCGNFSRAAELRHVTQPAFSRRIRALEDWLGATLLDRDTHRIELTAGGEAFRPAAEEILRRLRQGRDEARAAQGTAATTLRFAATHALSLTFFPDWLRGLEEAMPPDAVSLDAVSLDAISLGAVSLIADNMEACERLMLEGRAQFLLCHHHPTAATRLEGEHFVSCPVGADVLVPVVGPDAAGRPRHLLPGREDAPLPFLAYSETSGLGRILAAAHAAGHAPLRLRPVFTSHVATALRSMARTGRGIAWLPLSLVEEDLCAGVLVHAGEESWNVPIEIRLLRPRARQHPAAERFWSLVAAGDAGGSA